MKTPFFTSLIFVASLLIARADLTLVQKIEGAGSVTEMTIKLKGDKMRMEASPEVTTIIDSKSGEMLTLMNTQKKFLRISGDKAKAFVEMASKYSGDPATAAAEKPKLVSTGKRETINGFQTEEYACETPAFKASYWIALTYPDSATILKQLQAMTPSAWRSVVKGMPDYRDFPGLPLRTRMITDGKEITSTIVSVKQEPLAEAEFSPSKDFQEMKTPSIEGIMGGKETSPAPKP